MSANAKKFKRKLQGTVVSASNDKTIVVNVHRRFRHPTYRKYVHRTKKYHAHDEQNTAKLGDVVSIIEARPFSKLKRWELLSIRK